jgi:hypothetical protein
MSILLRDLRWYGSAVMPEDEVTTNIGAAIDTSRKPVFRDVEGAVQIVSDDGTDGDEITVSYLDEAGELQTEAQNLDGLTPVTYALTAQRLMKAVLTTAPTGVCALEAQTATRTGTLQAATADDVTLDAGASAVDQAYRGMVFRETNGLKQIAEILDYNGTTKKAILSRATTGMSGATTFTIADGMVFDNDPESCMEVRRIHYLVSADPPGGSTVVAHEKVFVKNNHATLTGTAAKIQEAADPSGFVTFALETTKDGTGDNGANPRDTAPAGGVGSFGSVDVDVVDTTLEAGAAQGIWLKLTLAAGEPASATSYTPQLACATI